MAMVSPESLNRCMKNWVSSLVPHLAEKLEAEEEEQKKKNKKKSLTIAIDGKEIRSTGKMNYYMKTHRECLPSYTIILTKTDAGFRVRTYSRI